ncbi:hypothetical protein OC846_000967 [Tilletia horrida]|uniref:Uncharacterized protein n=1 Tax=Tilletia horrida TaxID=155126 RepID=A0AAN6GWZ5_9BASI|nr:hypothetical protein OC846_000967 [Tilletia horrida]
MKVSVESNTFQHLARPALEQPRRPQLTQIPRSMCADIRYVEAWKRQSTSSRQPADKKTGITTTTTPYQVRLDEAGDGLTYAPVAPGSPHNTANRLFLQPSVALATTQHYDFIAEIEARRLDRQKNFKLGDYDGEDLDDGASSLGYDLRAELNRFDAKTEAARIGAPSGTSSIFTTTAPISDLFVPDPRPWRPLRYVRRTDPRQVLLLAHGLIVRNPDTGVVTGGIGVEFCPQGFQSKSFTKRIEKNLSHALEKPPDSFYLQTTEPITTKRAVLRSALAALEYEDWYEEGFHQIVIGVAHDWLVKGISSDIWRWRQDDWVVSSIETAAALGVDPGARVPDRDLWEMLDDAVKRFEKLDCNVRFWRVNRNDLDVAKELAINGASQDKARPETVRWRKKAFEITA